MLGGEVAQVKETVEVGRFPKDQLAQNRDLTRNWKVTSETPVFVNRAVAAFVISLGLDSKQK